MRGKKQDIKLIEGISPKYLRTNEIKNEMDEIDDEMDEIYTIFSNLKQNNFSKIFENQ